jgi:hypothetical protein
MWIGWYLADLKRCADPSGLEWWVSQYNNNAACPSYNNYDGYGSKDACWRAHFRNGANSNGNSYTDALDGVQSTRALCPVQGLPNSRTNTEGDPGVPLQRISYVLAERKGSPHVLVDAQQRVR